MFTKDNTEGFDDELDTLNEALDILTDEGMDEKSASDAINNAWETGLTAEQIIQRIANFGMVSGL